MVQVFGKSVAVCAALMTFTVFGLFSGASQADEQEIVIAAFGDSLSAGYQLPPAEAFPVQLEAALKKNGHKVRVLNAAVSGDTTSGGLARLDWSLGAEVDAVILELGANDALRGVDTKLTKANLEKIVARLKEREISILVTGMEAPRGMGEDYVKSFRAMFKDIADAHGTLYYPFFLEGIALDPLLNLADGMHPNGKGVAVVVKNILPSVEALIQRAKQLKHIK